MTISLRPDERDGPRRRLRGCSRLSVSASHRQQPGSAACDRIGDCSREDCPFHPARRSGRHRFCCSQAVTRPPASGGTVSAVKRFPGFRRAPCSVLPGLSSTACATAVILPNTPYCLVNAPRISTEARPQGDERVVPKEGFEPSRPYGHYALNVARLPIPPLRPMEPTIGFEPMTCCLRNSCSAAELRRRSRRRDSTMRQIQAQYAVFALRSVRIFPKGTCLAHKSRTLAHSCVSPTRH